MPPAGAADGHGYRLPAGRGKAAEQEAQQRLEQFQEAGAAVALEHIVRHPLPPAGVRPQVRHPMRVGQKAHVPDELRRLGTVLEAKGNKGDVHENPPTGTRERHTDRACM